MGMEEISVFAFTIENFERSKKDANLLMDLYLEFVEAVLDGQSLFKNIGFRFYGAVDFLLTKHQEQIAKIMKMDGKQSSKYLIKNKSILQCIVY